jgi:uncharacterized membrane protein YsdA (DUF1294 family)/cold shock CspA family protein
MRFDGTLKSWNDERGFGFIEPVQGGQEIFVHIKAFRRRNGRPQVGQALSFEVELGPQGKKRAKNVEPVPTSRTAAQRLEASAARWGGATLFVIPAFVVVVLVVAVLWRPPWVFSLAYLVLSAVAFAAYGTDKVAAVRGGWRVPENTLHLLAVAGGWPGALVAQQYLRHKSSKPEFRAVFWATVVINVVGYVVLCSPLGRPLWTGVFTAK